MSVPPPANEATRLRSLRAYGIFDTSPEEVFEELTSLASRICRTPIALLSLVDSQRTWFKSMVGWTMPEVPREMSFCARAILRPDVFIVPDARADERFRANPLVKSDPGILFYAGAPLVTSEGHALGTLCVMDHVPRQLSPEQIEVLKALARQTVWLLDQRRDLAKAERTVAELQRARERLAAQYRTTSILAESATFDEAGPKILRAICDTLGWEYGAVWTVDPQANVLRCLQTWPRLKTAQHVGLRVHGPDRAVFPPKRVADGPKDLRSGLVERSGLSQYGGGPVLGSQSLSGSL